jgi:toxin CcdB
MARFDVYRNPNPGSKDRIPYLLDIQANLLEGLATRLVVPLIAASELGPAIERLNPTLRVGSRNYVMATAEMAAVSRKSIGEKAATLEAKSAEILAAVDFLISGF